MERAATENSSPKTNQPFLGKSLVVSQSFKIGSFSLRFYGLFMAAAIALGYFVGWQRAKSRGWSRALYDDLAFWLVIFSFLGARVYYVLFYPQYYRGNFAEVFKIWHGGLAIYGAVIAGALTAFYFAKKRKVNFWEIADIGALALPLAQALGRFGNYFNYEAFGGPTSLPWKMFVPENFRPQGFENFSYFHPTFGYEAIWNVIVFAILLLIARKNPASGKLLGYYFIFYSIGRFFIEGLRLDSFYILGFKGDQLTALLLILLGIFIIIKRSNAPQNS